LANLEAVELGAGGLIVLEVNLRVAVAEQLLVDDRQQRVLYGRPGLPYLVEEHHVSRWQITL